MIDKLRGLVCLGTLLAFPLAIPAQDAAPDYKNPRLPIEQRVSDLLSRMTLEEKCTELYPAFTHQFIDTTGQYTSETAIKARPFYYLDFWRTWWLQNHVVLGY